MKYINAKGLTLSAMALGTVQLGLKYGLGEFADKPSEETAFQILDDAMEFGINTLDTANNYGASEAVIGNWLNTRKASGKHLPWIVTKIGPLAKGGFHRIRDDVLQQTETSLKKLKLDKIDCLMLHNFEDYAEAPDAMQKIFAELKSEGFCSYSAISAYSRHDYGVIADSGFDAVQIPLNIFDWTQIDSGGLNRLTDSGMIVFVRSIFLQGLVFHTPETLDPRMNFCMPYLKEFLNLCQEFSLSPAELALSFVLSLPGVTQAVIGCDTPKQVAENCKLFDHTVQLSPTQLDMLHDAFRDIDPRVINPGVWFNRMA